MYNPWKILKTIKFLLKAGQKTIDQGKRWFYTVQKMLSNSELLSILINIGTKEKSAVSVAQDILRLCSENLDELGKLSLKDMQKIKGVGPAKSVTIAAALELGRRRSAGNILHRPVIRSSKEMAHYLKEILKDKEHEMFAVLFLNHANKIKGFRIMSRGGITGTVADTRVILKQALEEGATALVLSHNHPSGNLHPSKADLEITAKIKQAAFYFDIRIMDHIIVSDEGYYSFADEGLL